MGGLQERQPIRKVGEHLVISDAAIGVKFRQRRRIYSVFRQTVASDPPSTGPGAQ
jgi:hypothetical protein